jgi:hypothetical protein
MSKYGDYLNAHPNARAGLRSALWAFIGNFSIAFGRFVAEVQDWAAGATAEFANIATLGRGVVAAIASTIAGLASYLYNKSPRTVKIQYSPEPPPPGPGPQPEAELVEP